MDPKTKPQDQKGSLAPNFFQTTLETELSATAATQSLTQALESVGQLKGAIDDAEVQALLTSHEEQLKKLRETMKSTQNMVAGINKTVYKIGQDAREAKQRVMAKLTSPASLTSMLKKISSAQDFLHKTLIEEALLGQNKLVDPIDEAIFCKIICTISRTYEAKQPFQKLNQSLLKKVTNRPSDHKSKEDPLGEFIKAINEKLHDFVSYIPANQEVVALFNDGLEEEYLKFKSTELTRKMVKKRLSLAKDELDHLCPILERTREATIAYSDMYFKHHKQLLKLCEQRDLSPAWLKQRQTTLFNELLDKIQQKLDDPALDKENSAAIKNQIIIWKETLKQHGAATKLNLTAIASSASHQFGELDVHEMLGLTPQVVSTPAAASWSVAKFRLRYAAGTITREQTTQNLCLACKTDERAKVTSFLLSLIKSDDKINEKYKDCLNDKYKKFTPLEHAAKNNSLKNVKLLLTSNSIKDLDKALQLTTDEAIKRLIQYKIDERLARSTALEVSATLSSATTFSSSSTTSSSSGVTHQRSLIADYSAGLAALHGEIQYLTHLAELERDRLATTVSYDKFITKLDSLNDSYQQLSNLKFEECLNKILESEQGPALAASLKNLGEELEKNQKLLTSYLQDAKKSIPAILNRAKKELEQLAPPKKTPVKATLQKLESKSKAQPKTTLAPKVADSKIEAQPSSSSSSTLSSFSPAERPSLPFSAQMLFWHGERVFQSSELRKFCEFSVAKKADEKGHGSIVASSNLILKRIQLYAIMFKLMQYFEMQSKHAYLPVHRRDAMPSQAKIFQVVRNSLVHSLRLLENEDMLLDKYLAEFKDLGKTVADFMLNKDPTTLNKHPQFVKLHKFGKSLNEKMPEFNEQYFYLFHLDMSLLEMYNYGGISGQPLTQTMLGCALQMANIRKAKYCAEVTGHTELRHYALASTHITPLDNELSDDEITAHVAKNLEGSWSSRGMKS